MKWLWKMKALIYDPTVRRIGPMHSLVRLLIFRLSDIFPWCPLTTVSTGPIIVDRIWSEKVPNGPQETDRHQYVFLSPYRLPQLR